MQCAPRNHLVAASPSVLSIEDILGGVEKAVSMSDEAAEAVQLETTRIIKVFKKPRSNLSTAENHALHTLQSNVNFALLPVDKDSALDYMEKILAMLDDLV
jgi:hypothetical protein